MYTGTNYEENELGERTTLQIATKWNFDRLLKLIPSKDDIVSAMTFTDPNSEDFETSLSND